MSLLCLHWPSMRSRSMIHAEMLIVVVVFVFEVCIFKRFAVACSRDEPVFVIGSCKCVNFILFYFNKCWHRRVIPA